MTETVATLNFLFSTGALILLGAGLVVLFDMYGARALSGLMRRWGIFTAFLVTTAATLAALLYSEVFGFLPCGLCWLQRVFIFPQVFILGVALWYKDTLACRYGIALSVPGLLIALYQYYLQMGGGALINCPAAAATDCAKRYIFEFGFVTFPFLAVALFVFLIALYLYILKTQREVPAV